MKKYSIVILIIVVAVAGIFGIFFFNSGISPTQTSPQVSLQEKYINSVYFFSFEHSKATQIEEVRNAGSETILVTDALGSFQIHITPFDEKGSSITKERLIRDIPDLKIEKSESIVVDKNAQGLEFISEENGEKKKEVWFVAKGYLYQITAPIESEAFMKKTLATWKESFAK